MAGMTTQKRTGWTLSIMGMMALCGAAMGGATIVRLETLGGTSSQGFGINDNGVVVGQAATSGDAALHAVMWINGVATDLDPAGTDSAAYAVNNSDQIVGKGDRLGGGSDAMLWDSGTATNLGIDMSAVGSSVAWDINDNGLVVGQGSLGPGFAKGFVWSGPGAGIVAGSIPGYMGGANYGVNNDGTVVGSSFFFGDPDDAHLATLDGHGDYSSVQISPAGFLFAQARAVNNSGVIMGHSGSPMGGPWNACIFNADHDNTIQSLGTLPDLETSEGFDINDQGVMVGWATDDDFVLDAHAWVYADGQMTDLNTLLDPGQTDWIVLLAAEKINNNNDIVGWGIASDGELAGFVMYGVLAPTPCVGDVTGPGGVPDGLVNVDDLNEILSAWGMNVGIGSRLDLANNDGIIDVDDLNALLSNWNATCG